MQFISCGWIQTLFVYDNTGWSKAVRLFALLNKSEQQQSKSYGKLWFLSSFSSFDENIFRYRVKFKMWLVTLLIKQNI